MYLTESSLRHYPATFFFSLVNHDSFLGIILFPPSDPIRIQFILSKANQLKLLNIFFFPGGQLVAVFPLNKEQYHLCEHSSVFTVLAYWQFLESEVKLLSLVYSHL